MGRNPGFYRGPSPPLALKDVNFVLIPEAQFQLEGEGGLLPAIEQRLRERGHAVIVTAEGFRGSICLPTIPKLTRRATGFSGMWPIFCVRKSSVT